MNSLPRSIKGENNFDLYHLTNDKKFDHVGLADTGRHLPPLPDGDIILHKICGNFISQQIDSSSDYNHHCNLLGSYQHGVTTSLTDGNIYGRRIYSGRNISGLGRWSGQ